MFTRKNDDLLANAPIGEAFCRLVIPAVAAQPLLSYNVLQILQKFIVWIDIG